MARKVFEWDDPDDEEGNVFHIARHGVTTEEAEYVVLDNGNRIERSRSSSHRMTFGSTRTFFTRWDSPRVDTRYFTPSTSTGVTGIFCGCLLARLMRVRSRCGPHRSPSRTC